MNETPGPSGISFLLRRTYANREALRRVVASIRRGTYGVGEAGFAHRREPEGRTALTAR
ncbi:MAG: hypothetical protein F6K35_36650 [Okeania sp. SIO2H7]|nr:hypothetical protein [Okeania sp. SIO2H7]